MPNGNTHKIAGIFLGASTYLIIQNNSKEKEKVDFRELILSTLVGTSSSRIPDILEPATNPNHRAFFHSFAFGFLAEYAGVQIWRDLKARRSEREMMGIQRWDLNEFIDLVLIIMLGSILLHLLMDAFTPKGIPII